MQRVGDRLLACGVEQDGDAAGGRAARAGQREAPDAGVFGCKCSGKCCQLWLLVEGAQLADGVPGRQRASGADGGCVLGCLWRGKKGEAMGRVTCLRM